MLYPLSYEGSGQRQIWCCQSRQPIANTDEGRQAEVIRSGSCVRRLSNS